MTRSPGLEALELSAADVERIRDAEVAVDQEAVVVRPHTDNSGILGMDEVLRSLPRGETETTGLLRRRERDTAAPFAFEARYAPDPVAVGGRDERVLSLQYVGTDERTSDLLGRQLPDKYPDSRTERRPASWLDPDPGQYMAVATLGLRRYTLYPLRNVRLDEFRRDPTGSILTEMVGAAEAGGVDADVAVQIMARPTATDWKQGVPGGYGIAEEYGDGLTAEEEAVTAPLSTKKLRWFLNQPTHERRAILPTPVGSALGRLHPAFRDEFEHPPSEADKQAAKMLSDLDGRAWAFHARIVAVSDDRDLARERVTSTAEMFDNFYEYRGNQTFIPVPKAGDEAIATAAEAAGREWPEDPEQTKIKPQIEVAGLLNIPEAEHVSTNKMKWALATPGEGIPPGTPRFDYDRHGLNPGDTDREALQAAMFDAAGPDEPLWYGTGVRHGTEAGVFQDSLYHQFVGGATRQGKTTLLTNFAAQAFRGGGGGLVIDPKGKDAEEFLAEWPEDRDSEDLVVMDLTDDRDRRPQFNFLEIPDYLDPEADARAFTSYVEALAEDITAMVAEAGGSDKYMGARMKRVVKAVVRGLARADETATLLDVAAVCASPENLSKFREKMAEERFQFLRETAERLEEQDEKDLEPLAGRMDEWVLNSNIRELICAREPSFSINEAVREGRWIVVKHDPSGSETEAQMLGTALIRRSYFAQRYTEPEHSFDMICDEFDNIASEESNIHKILSEAAAFDYRCTLACQAPTNQLPSRVRSAIENQCGTFLSFNPGGGDDADWIQQQHTVDSEDLQNLSRFRFYMRGTTRDDDLTHSYMVRGFPPAREARGDPRTDEEINALVEDSLDRYGEAIQGEEAQRASSPYIGEAGEDTDTASLDVTDRVVQAAVAAVYDTAIRQGDPGGRVPFEACVDAVRRRIARLSETPAPEDVRELLDTPDHLWKHVLQEIPESEIERTPEDEEMLLKAQTPRVTLAGVGKEESAGDRFHAEIMWDAYEALTWAGIDMTIHDASGDDPDGLARPAPESEQHAPELVERLVGDHDEARIESEKSTTESKGGYTVQHVLQAAEESRRAIVLCRPDAAEKTADKLLREPQYARSDHTKEGETRYYNVGDLKISHDGERTPMTRPGSDGDENIWVRKQSGDIVLRDSSGTVHARFEDARMALTDAHAYPGGDRAVKRPVIPEAFDTDIEPHAEILAVPEGADGLRDLALVTDGDGLTIPTDVVGQQDDPPTSSAEATVTPEDLNGDVNANARDLLRFIHDHPAVEQPFTKRELHELAGEHGPDNLDATRQAVNGWVNALDKAGAVEELGRGETGAMQWRTT